ncbi:CobQ/CobB/MinD/ParA nucleotide binding domain protein (plasmid) [Borreliella burgdorferi 29805]|uniref:ParA family protein n=1 Tax=Borreliella burgdorferi TaxID=139 RepID=UPI00017F42AC|nr:ParA family protein [Borreliella burgdorferi]ACO38513.1 CobQ/CobB/MinD/ParA nucleotide binding domain protein [Borreliella burgdorferi 29805]ATH10578.1 ParA family protein [Borreliella burgdorferi]MCD2371998.1 ParA family protein [Borreliella burgdorferi]MCD2375611.1 ParA family protein [Borreliella burgdorferi]MCD2379181.1 ParA family protein [Borreliella burgdorferi]
MDTKKPKIITIASIKGGVGKSMLSIIFSYILSEMNNKVLIVDLDPQNSLTSYFLQYIRNIELNNVYYLLKRDQNIAFNEYINSINNNMYIIPAHPILCKFEKGDIPYKELMLEYIFDKNLHYYNFDYVVIDTPPSLSSLLFNALNITHKVIIPIQAERWSVESLPILMNEIKEVEIIRKKNIDVLIIENQFIKNRNTYKDIESILQSEYKDLIKGRVHFYNSIKVFINELKEPNNKEIYYQEIKKILNNMF